MYLCILQWLQFLLSIPSYTKIALTVTAIQSTTIAITPSTAVNLRGVVRGAFFID